VILDDDSAGGFDPDSDIASVSGSTSLGVGANAAFEPNKPADPVGRDAWWDIEDRRWVDDNQHPILPLEQEDLDFTTPRPWSHSRRHSAGSSHVSPHDKDGNSQGTSQDSSPCLLVSAAAPSSPAPHLHSTKPLQNQGTGHFQAETTRTRTEEPRDICRFETLDKGEKEDLVAERVGEEQHHEEEEVVVGVMRGIEVQREWQQQHKEGDELAGEDEELAMEEHPHDEEQEDSADNFEDEEDEDLQPAKRRKLPSVSAKETLKLARGHNPKLDVGQPRRRTSPTFIQIEIDARQSQTEDLGFTDNEPHNTLPPSRSPSNTAESVLAAEYEEWPLHGFLKRTRIGSTVSFNLEFHLTHVPEHLELSGLPEALCSSIKTSAQRQTSDSAVAHSKTRYIKSRRRTKGIPWTKEEDETLVKMKTRDGCSWEEISDALPSRTTGAIQVHYSTKFSRGTRSRKRLRS
jgi:hypothetical protein